MFINSPGYYPAKAPLGELGDSRRDVTDAISHIVSALRELLGLRHAPGVYRSKMFISCLAVGTVFWGMLPFLVAAQPLPWHRIVSLAFLLAVVWQPIVEEFVFRGCLQGFLFSHEWGQQSLLGISRANILTSVLFAGAHVATHSPIWALLMLFPSLLFGVLRDRSRSVFPPIVLHIIYNAGYFLLAGGSSLV
jgi:membrane protease YdiL (CAAX protease family)